MIKIVTTTGSIDNATINEYLGVVCANVVVGTNIFSDFAASIRDIIGGRSRSYQRNLDKLYDKALEEIKEKALELNANAIVGVKIDVGEISGAGKSMFMVTATGTAVRFE